MCSLQAFTRSAQRADIRQARKHQALILEALSKASSAGRPVLFLQYAREAIPWSSKLNETEFDAFLGEFIRADWRDEPQTAAVVAKWIDYAGSRRL